MKEWLQFISIIASFSTLIAFIAIFIKIGRDKGAQDVTLKELRKDVDGNGKDINMIKKDINDMQIKNTAMMTSLSSDLGWIKSSLADIKIEMKSKK